MRKSLALITAIIISALSWAEGTQEETLLFGTSFQTQDGWTSQTVSSGEQTVNVATGAYPVTFTLSQVKVDPTNRPSSMSSYTGSGYIQLATKGASSSYVQTSAMPYVTKVTYTHATTTSGGGWGLQYSMNGEEWTTLQQDPCAETGIVDTREVQVNLPNVMLRWYPLSTSNINSYLMDVDVYGMTIIPEGGDGGNTAGGQTGIERIYCRMTYEWWATEDAAVGLYAYADGDVKNAEWPGERMSKVEGEEGLWFADVDRSLYTNIIFTRVNGSGTIADWGAKTADLTIPTDGNNLYTITSAEAVWGDPGVEGVWSYYDNTAGTGGVTITGYSLVGDSALFGGAEWDVTNEATNMTQTGDFTWMYTLDSVYLKAYRNYAYKVVANHTWGISDYPSGGENYTLAVEQSGIYRVTFTFETSVGCTPNAELIRADESGGENTNYSNYAAVINLERMVQFVFSGTDEDDMSQYEAHVQLNQGDTLYIRDRLHNVMLEFTVEEYGAYTNFTYTNSGSNYDKIAYVVCQQSGCYDLFYKSNYSLYLGEGTDGCSEGEPYDEGSMQTAHVSLYGDYGYVYINDNVSSGDFVLGSTITLSAQPYSNYQFLEWSDGNYANPRQFVVTGDTTIKASFGSKDIYPTGILINRKKFIRSTFNDGTQLIVRANIAEGDTVELYFINDNIFWMAPVEQFGAYQNFSGGEADGHLICNVAGCYDIYFKLEDGLTQSIYIGEGTQCFDGEEWVSPIQITQEVCYLIGKNDNLGAWNLAQAQPINKDGTTITLPAGMYQFKLLPQNDSWENSYGSKYIYSACSSDNITTDADGNIVIVLEEESDIHISFGDYGICLTGNFVQANTSVHLTIGVTPEDAGTVTIYPESDDYLIETELSLQAHAATGGWEFDKWSDGVNDNPRTVKLTQDTTIIAEFTPGEYGILINRRQLARGTYTGRLDGSYIAQFKSSVNLEQGDKIQAINLTHGNNSTWLPDLEEGGSSANFSVSTNQSSLVCNVAGCYDIYSKIHYGQSNDGLYIGSGEDCQPTEYFPLDATGDSIVVYSVVGSAELFGEAWNTTDAKTNMTLSPEGVYIYTLDSVTLLPDNDYQYKVIANHAWDVDVYPSTESDDNYHLSVQTAGVYSVTFTLIQGVRAAASINYLHTIQEDQPCGIVASGECGADGANVTWLLTCDSILTIGGDGRMADYNEETTIAPWYEYRDAYHSVYIAAGVLNAGDLAFRESPNLRYVDLASTVVSLGNYSFYNCPNLHSLTLPESVTTLSDNTPFGGTTTMTNPVLNSSVFVRLPEDYAGEYTVAEGTTVIASQAFKGCNQLTSLVLPNTVHILSGSSIFENCAMLVSVNIPEGVTALGEFTFSNCSSLKAIDLPSTLASLGSYCFGECWMIESITCRATTPPEANGSALSGVNYMIPIYVPAGTAEIYKAADGWSGFTDYREIENGGSTPTEAASTPTYPATQVKAIYSPAYQADCDFGEWGSGTIYSQEDFGKKYETNELGYFGLEFTSLNCTNMEYLHFDIWIAEDASVRFVPIWGGEEQGITRNLYAQQWNSVDIPLNEFDAVTDWFNVYQVKIDNAANLTFWIGNAYFYTTLAIAEDSNAPYNITASLISSSFFGFDLQLNGMDDSGILTYSILQGETVLDAVSGMSGTSVTKQIGGLNSSTTYNLIIIASDESGNQSEAVTLVCTTIQTPAPADTPMMSSDSVLSLYSDAYPFAPASLTTYNAGWWEPPFMTVGELAVNDSALFYHSASSGMIGWEFKSINATGYPYFNIAIYPIMSGTINISVMYGDGAALETHEYRIENNNLIGGQWNYLSFDLSDKDLSSIWQISLSNYFDLDGFFVDNVYFSKSSTELNPSGCAPISGKCGAEGDSTNVLWELTCDSILFIRGTGAMADYYDPSAPYSGGDFGGDPQPAPRRSNINKSRKALPTGYAPWLTYTQSIKSIRVEEGVTRVGANAFNGCSTTKAVTLPSTLQSIGEYAFNYLISLDSLTCGAATPPTTEANSFNDVNSAATLQVPTESVSAYQVADGWKSFAKIQAIGESTACSPASGTCGAEGDNLIWMFTCDSVLTISGSGAMANYNGSSEVPWHDYQTAIRTAIISEGVTSLSSSSTFENCTALESVVIPEGITSLGMYTFGDCSSLKAVDLPSTLTSIGSYCFTNCWAIESIICRATTPPEANGSSLSGVNYMIPIYVPAGTTNQYLGADGWSGFTDYREIESGCIIASGECGAQGDNVTWSISCDSVMYIRGTGAMATYKTNSNGQAPWASYGLHIRDIIIEEGVTSLSAYGFYNAGSYTNGAYANVHSVSIPSTVSKVVNNNFYQCPLLTVTINSDTIVGQGSYSSSSTLQNIFGVQVRQYIIGDSVKSIASAAFRNQSADSLRSVILPDGITSIGDWAFGYLENMDSISLPSALQSIGADAFYGSGLKHIEIPAGVTTIGGQAFQNCVQLTSVILPEGLTTIGTSMFFDCNALTEIIIPESVQTIGANAFSGYTNLTKATILSPTWVAEDKSTNTTAKQILGSKIRHLIIGEHVTTLGKYAFSEMDSLRIIDLPSGLNVIGEYAFSKCSSLQVATIPDAVTTIGNYAFGDCRMLDSLTLNEGLTRIGTQAFYQCYALRRITLPESLRVIGEKAFYLCTNLTEMTIPSNVDSLGTTPFGSCSIAKMTINSNAICSQNYESTNNLNKNLYQINAPAYIIGEGVTAIGDFAFSGSGMKSLTLPSTLTQIGNNSFNSCPSLATVTCNALTPPSMQSGSFNNQDTLIVPCEAKSLYKAADYWMNFSTIRCEGDNDLSEKVLGLTHQWTFVMLPSTFGMSADDVTIEGEVEWATYNGSNRAIGKMGWETCDASAVHMCSNALIVRAKQDTATIIFQVPAQAVSMAEVSLPLYQHTSNHPENANWNFVGNPYPYPYNTTGLQEAGIEAITVWNGTGYDTFSPGIDDYILQPFETFFIQLPTTDAPESLNFLPMYIVQ